MGFRSHCGRRVWAFSRVFIKHSPEPVGRTAKHCRDRGSSAAHSSTSKAGQSFDPMQRIRCDAEIAAQQASNGLVRKLTEQLGYSWHQAFLDTSCIRPELKSLESKGVVHRCLALAGHRSCQANELCGSGCQSLSAHLSSLHLSSIHG